MKCECGKNKESERKVYCEECRSKRKKEDNRLRAIIFRLKNGSVCKRGIYCSRCKLIKEHQERGYCLACERARYLEKSKPDCATCGTLKENPRDAYCKKCKREKSKQRSIEKGLRKKNSIGRKTSCSNCGREKEKSNLNESYCKSCKAHIKKMNRPFRNDEQKFKDSVRKLTIHKIRQGVLIRKPCATCGTNERVEAHHDDYTKPLDVRWLCRKHHQEHHKQIKLLED